MSYRMRLVNVVIVFALILGGTVFAAGEKESAAAEELDKLILTSGGVSIPHTPTWVGLELGIFKKNGLDVEIKRVASGFEALAAVQTGDAHVADAVVAVVAQAAQQGIDVDAVTMANGDPSDTIATDAFFAIIGRKEKGGRVGDLSSIIGKKVGTAKGTVAHQYLYYALKDNGYDPQKDIEVVHVSPPDLPSALQSGSVDAISSWEPMPLLALENVPDAVEVYRGGQHIQYLFQRWMKPEFIEKNPDIVRKFVVAYAESAQFTRQNPDRVVEIMAKNIQGLSKDRIQQAVGYLTFDPRVSKSTLQAAEQGLEFARIMGFEGEFSFEDHVYFEGLDYLQEKRADLLRDFPDIPSNLKLDRYR